MLLEENLHPSWEASRKKKLLNEDTTLSDTKIIFYDYNNLYILIIIII